MVGAFLKIPDHVLWIICVNLTPHDILALGRTCRSIWHLLTSSDADAALWKNLVLLTVRKFQQQRTCTLPAPLEWSSLAGWSVSTFRELLWLAMKAAPLLGYWRWENPPRGGLVVIEPRRPSPKSDGFHVRLLVPNSCSADWVETVTGFLEVPLFHIVVQQPMASRGSQASSSSSSSVSCSGSRPHMNWLDDWDGPPVRVEPAAAAVTAASTHKVSEHQDDGERVLVYKIARPPENFLDSLIHGNLDDQFWPDFGAYLRALTRDGMTIHRLTSCSHPTVDPLMLRLVGLYRGLYGPHGFELIHLSVVPPSVATSSLHRLVGLKVTGDPNVPSGALTFRGVGPIHQSEMADITCSCMYHCECWNHAEDGVKGGWTVVGVMPIEGQTAMHGYQNPQWNPGRLVIAKKLDKATGADIFMTILVWDNLFSNRLFPYEVPRISRCPFLAGQQSASL